VATLYGVLVVLGMEPFRNALKSSGVATGSRARPQSKGDGEGSSFGTSGRGQVGGEHVDGARVRLEEEEEVRRQCDGGSGPQ